MQVNFKSRIKRTEASCYKLIQRPISNNEGVYKVNFDPVDAKPR